MRCSPLLVQQIIHGGGALVPKLIFLIAIMNTLGVVATSFHHFTPVTIKGLGDFEADVNLRVYLSPLIILVHPTYNYTKYTYYGFYSTAPAVHLP